VFWNELEAVAQADLHHAGLALNRGEVGPVRWSIQSATLGVSGYANAGAAAVDGHDDSFEHTVLLQRLERLRRACDIFIDENSRA